MRSELYFQSSPWWLLLCLVVGAVYAFALYQRSSGWSKQTNYGLAALRFVVVSLICFLLLNPLIRSVRTITEKPKVVLAIDNSESMTAAGQTKLQPVLTAVDQLRERLAGEDIDVSVQTLGDSSVASNLTDIRFNQRSTDLAGMLSGIRTTYEGRNLTDVVLLSDGIANQGLSPTFGRYNFAVYTIGVGDTIPKRDVQLKDIAANKIAYLNNQFPIQADVASYGFQGKNGAVVLRQNGRELGRQTVNFNRSETFQSVTFQTTSAQKGVQHYVVEVVPQSGEFTARNNRRDVYIDIIDGKEKILLLALAPHPDIKAIRSVIEKNQNYELDIRILNAGGTDIPNKPYDLVILHQLPDNLNIGSAVVQRVLQKNTPVLFVLGSQSSLSSFNGLNPVMQITAGGGQTDKVTGRFNADYRQLNFDAQKLNILDQLPPMAVPFGDYKLSPGSEVVLWQQVGSVKTNKPLLALNTTSARKAAVLAGEGLWEWRLEEYAQTESQAIVDELLQKVMQLVSVKEDRRKLRVYPTRNEFLTGEKATFETEMYNDIYEKLYSRPVQLEIVNERSITRSFTYTPTESNTRFEVSNLPEGVYHFRATASLNGKTETATGEFIVREQQLEALNTTADHLMLRQLAQQTGGRFYNAATVNALADDLIKQRPTGRLTSSEELNELINLRWLFFLVLVLVGIEWGLRKYNGAF